MKTVIATGVICALFVSPVLGTEVPQLIRTEVERYSASTDASGAVRWGELEQTRTEYFDARGRLIRWEERGPKGQHELSWVGLYFGDDRRPRRASYWSGDGENPFPELMVSTRDERFTDVLYSDFGEKPRRQMREYVDDWGREIYQEYFGPKSQKKYSEEIYRYDDDGNESGRVWQRLDGRSRRDTRFEIVRKDSYGSWVERNVFIDGKLSHVDERKITYGDVMIEQPGASAGPVTPNPEILPVPFASGVVSVPDTGENMPSFASDGRQMLFTRYKDEWQVQSGFFSEWRDGTWREPEPLPFADTMYNAAFRSDGERVIYCERDDGMEGGRVFVVTRTKNGWSKPADLTRKHDFTGSYFCWLSDGTLYFHRGGDIYRCVIDQDRVIDEQTLGPPINTEEGVEFSCWADENESVLFFTRDVEDNPEGSGVFVSQREGKQWSEPRKLPIPYGWGPTIGPDGEDLVYVINEDIFRVPLVLLGVNLPASDE